MTHMATARSVLINKILSIVEEKIEKSQVPLVSDFIYKLYAPSPLDCLSGRSDADLYGAGISLWNMLNLTSSKQNSIRVYNPSLGKHGWQSIHTIVEIIVPDAAFLVDSVRMLLKRREITTHLMLHQPLSVGRDKKDRVCCLNGEKIPKQTALLIEIDRISNEEQMAELRQELLSILIEIGKVVSDWQPMTKRLEEIIAHLKQSKQLAQQYRNTKDSIKFLCWLNDHNFIFMGYQNYQFNSVSGDYKLVPNPETSLGLLVDQKEATQQLSQLPKAITELMLGDNLLIIAKSCKKSLIHRLAYMDQIGIKIFDKSNQIVGEHRFIGLYASTVYDASILDIPLISNKIHRILKSSGFVVNSHSHRSLLNILENHPRDELIQSQEQELLETCVGIMQIQERDLLRLFVRKDPYGRYFFCLVYVSKDNYSTSLRAKCQDVLKDYFGSTYPIEFNVRFTEGQLARAEYFVKVDNSNIAYDLNELQNNLIEAARGWKDKLRDALVANFGEERANTLFRKYANVFSHAYMDDVLPGAAVADVQLLESLNQQNTLNMLFYRPQEEGPDSKLVKLRLFQKREPIHLSDVLPILENMGLKVIGERPYQLDTTGKNSEKYWILDFSMFCEYLNLQDVERYSELFQQALLDIWNQELEDDGFNKLVLKAGLSGREVIVFRSYAKYMQQIGTSFSQQYIENTLVSYPEITKLLLKLFFNKFNPKKQYNKDHQQKLKEHLLSTLDTVSNLDDDRIVCRYIDLIEATLRTNYFQRDEQGKPKAGLSFKIAPKLIPDMPQPLPAYEIYVYSPKIEGVHLRGGKVARGGLRWSDRKEDFRTEVLGLLKAQQVKNTVIIPAGAKGGFVCKRLPSAYGRQAIFREGQDCYRIFICSLLDITDNNVAGKILYPTDVVRHDDDDPYLVVAADKGTATFSDLANEISQKYNFWLGDAFASGGSVGYDHKKIGITAKGSWESVKRHFREMNIDCHKDEFTCIGIGDMSGDVFGNGMLLSKTIKLIGAFDHQHIFIDPSPDTASSFKERHRLFVLPNSRWSDYNTSLISKGGGVFLRTLKSIKLTSEMKKMLKVTKVSMSPNDLIRRLLCCEVDLLWSGGVGTYVKAGSESHLDVGDRTNDALRVNGSDIKAKVVGEGGNLGFTQLGRIEYAINKGRINTDFIDNVGGVDCSDNEVNIKILLNGLVAKGELTVKQRNQLLFDMTDEVVSIVLDNAYQQTGSISVTHEQGYKLSKNHLRFIHELEHNSRLNRALEYLPSDAELSKRTAAMQGLTRPELSVLLAYAKMVLKDELNTSDITENPYFYNTLVSYFPNVLQQKFKAEMKQHPLKGEIIATRIANCIVNTMGMHFVHHMMGETGASVSDIAICFTIAYKVFDMNSTWIQLEGLDSKLATGKQGELMFLSRRMLRQATRWFLRNRTSGWTIEHHIQFYNAAYLELSSCLRQAVVSDEAIEIKQSVTELTKQGINKNDAEKIACYNGLFSALNLIQVAQAHQWSMEKVATLYFHLGAKMDLHWFLKQINKQPVDNYWQSLARTAFREELDWEQRRLTSAIIGWGKKNEVKEQLLSNWLKEHENALKRWYGLLANFRTSTSHDFAKFPVALRELKLLTSLFS